MHSGAGVGGHAGPAHPADLAVAAPAALAERAQQLAAARVPFVQALVVRALHPTSAHAGDTALVLADGTIEGFVGGTCAQQAVRDHALAVLVSGEPLLLRIMPGKADVVTEPGAVTVQNPCVSGGAIEVFLEPRRPPARLLVVGDTPVARALVALAGPLGMAAGVYDEDAVDGAAAVVVASHGRGEEAALEAALRADVPYVGLVASRVRGAAVLAGLSAPGAQRVHSPAGLELGCRTAPEIALSVLAQMVASRPGPAQVQVQPAPQPAAGVSAVDPVCGMTVPIGPDSLSLETAEGTRWFCCAPCRTTYASRLPTHG